MEEQPPHRYVLTARERSLFQQYLEAMVRIEASMQGALQLIVLQNSLESPRGFTLDRDSWTVVEQQQQQQPSENPRLDKQTKHV